MKTTLQSENDNIPFFSDLLRFLQLFFPCFVQFWYQLLRDSQPLCSILVAIGNQRVPTAITDDFLFTNVWQATCTKWQILTIVLQSFPNENIHTKWVMTMEKHKRCGILSFRQSVGRPWKDEESDSCGLDAAFWHCQFSNMKGIKLLQLYLSFLFRGPGPV